MYAVVQLGVDDKGYGVLGSDETRQGAIADAEERHDKVIMPVALAEARDGDIVVVSWAIIVLIREEELGDVTGPPSDYLLPVGD